VLRFDETTRELRIPSEIDALVGQVYDDSPAPCSLTAAECDYWAKTYAKHREMIEREEREAEDRQIKKPQFRGALARLMKEAREEDNPDLHPAHQALTRLTRPTASLICLENNENGAYRLPHDNSEVPSLRIRRMAEGGFDDVRRVILAEVSSSHRGLIEELRESPRTPPEWTDVGFLSRHHLVLFTKGKARLGGYELTLSNSLGLTISRVGEEREDE
jgi:CRISPR-associated endonuclease/helicase Cas3